MVEVVGTVFNVAALWFLSRRLLGVPVGWGRTLIVSAIVNAGGFTALHHILTSLGATPSTPGPQLALFSTLMAAWALTIQLIVLTVLEAIIPTRSVPSLMSVVRGAPSQLRRARRYLAIWWILAKNGLGAYLGPTSAPGADVPRLASSLRQAMTDAGVTFVKLGQMLSTRADLLPASFVTELSRLQTQVPPEPWEAVEPAVLAALGRPAEEVFASFDREPFAAASVAQIHGATLADGSPVVVKLQRPRARAQATADLDIVLRFAQRLEQRTDWGRRIGALALAQGFAASLDEELDYRVELGNMRAVAAAGGLRVPRAYPEFSSERVLVMERIDGTQLGSAAAELAALSVDRRRELAGQLFDGVLRQLLVTGVFHADLHPGNILLTDDGLALLDFGSVGRLDRSSRTALGLLLLAVDREDAIGATDALIDLLDRPEGLDDRLLERELGQLILRFGAGVGSAGTAGLFGELFDLILRHGFSVPPQLAAAFRALGALEGSLALLDPGLDVVALARSSGSSLMQGQVTPEAVRETLEQQLATVVPLIQRLPRRLSRITEQLEDGSLTVNVRTLGQASERSYITSLVQQISTAVLASAAGIGGVMLLSTNGGPAFLPHLSMWAFLGLTFLFIAFVLGARVLVDIFHGRR